MRRIAFYLKHVSMLPNWVSPLVPYLRDAGFEPVVLHCSELNREGTASGETGTFPGRCIDLSGMTFKQILATLAEVDACSLVFFTFRSLGELLLLRCARRRGLRTIYVQHGFHVSTRFLMAELRASIRRYGRLLRWYGAFVRALPTGAAWTEVRLAWRAMARADYREARFDHGVFYGAAGLADTARVFGFSRDEVRFSGYPLANGDQDLRDLLRHARDGGDHVLYVHQPLVLDGLARISREREAEFLRSLAESCRRSGRRLALKIHPRESVERYRGLVGGAAAVLEPDVPTSEALARAEVVVGHFSTALFAAVYVGKTVVILDFPGLDNRYYGLFDRIGLRAREPQELEAVLNGGGMPAAPEREDFIERHIGRNNSFEHQARTLVELTTAEPAPPAGAS